MVIAQRVQRDVRELLQDGKRARPLDGKLRIAFSGIFNARAEPIPRADVLEVAVLIAGVHTQEVMRI